MPDAVERNQKVRLLCKYNLEGETLYTLKWYRGEQEFYRFTPKEPSPIKIFAVKGYPELEIVREESNGEQVTLSKALPSISGRYSCEVTTDAPSFHAQSAQAELRVVVLPTELPYIKGNRPKIKPGEWANVTCIMSGSIPAANLTWTINNKPVTGKYNITNSQRVLNAIDQEESISNLLFQADERHFIENSVKVRCTASVYSIFQRISEIAILLDRPNKWLYKPQTQRDPTPIQPTNVKSSRSDVSYHQNNANNVIEAKNLLEQTSNDGNTPAAASIVITLFASRVFAGYVT